ncbi:MAG: heme ABC exporter ATP-binding protein CcmA [Nevskia sp.]|nr:heme ABC exporter ATP-binding protein CcmA [Nevskia sp.]
MSNLPIPGLNVVNLAVARGDRTIFEGLGFAVAPGEILHIRGRNGAGKTSLLEVLCDLRAPAAGTVSGRPEPHQQHWIGHKNALNPALSPRENLAFWCALNGCQQPGLDAALQRVGVRALRHRPCGSLSTGQRRRAALARLCVAPRPWWYLDEPLAGLDSSGVELLAGLLAAHAAGGGAAVLTSHQALPDTLSGVRILELVP